MDNGLLRTVGFPGGSVVKNPPVNTGDWIRSLGQEDPLEKEMATYSSILCLGNPWTEEPGGLQSIGHKESDMTESMHPHPKGEWVFKKFLSILEVEETSEKIERKKFIKM